jgi:hypothetical protein
MIQRLATLAVALLGASAVMVVSIIATYWVGWLHNPAGSIDAYLRHQMGLYAGVLSVLSWLVILAALRSGPKLFGLCMPAGSDWLVLFPGVVLGGLSGGAWTYAVSLTSSELLHERSLIEIAIAMALPVAAEVLFRGLAHGTLAERFPTQRAGGPWFLSWPVLISSLLYALWTSLPFLPFFDRDASLTFAGAILFGISSGMARERSESLLPCVILHWSCVLMLAFLSF